MRMTSIRGFGIRVLQILQTLQLRAWSAPAILACGLLLATVPGHADNPERSRTFYEDAVRLLQEGDGNAAFIQLRNAIQQDPTNWPARSLLGRLYLQAGDAVSAEKELRRVFDNAPSAEVEVLLGYALVGIGRFQDALDIVRPDADDRASRLERSLLRGDAYLGLTDLDNAETHYQEVLAAEPDNLRGLFAMARLDTARGRLDSAAQRLETIIDTVPDRLEVWLLRADVEARRNDPDAALAALDRAAAIAPDSPQVILPRAQLLLQLGQLSAAEALVGQALARQPDNLIGRYLQATIQLATGQFDEAHRTFLSIEDRTIGSTPALLLGGLIKYHVGQYAQAERSIARYITQEPDNLAARRVLAAIYLRTDNLPAATETLEATLDRAPDDPLTLQLLASTRMRQGDHDGSVAAYERLRDLGVAQSGGANTVLSLLGIAADETDVSDQLLPVQPDVSTGILLVLDYLRTRQFDAAQAELDRLQVEEPDNPVLLNLAAAVQLSQGNVEAARQALERALEIDPDLQAALDNLNRLDLADDRGDVVEQRLRDRLAARPDDPQAVLGLAQFLGADGRVEETIDLLAGAVAARPDDLALQRALISAYLTSGAIADALGATDRLATTAADDIESLRVVAEAYAAAGGLDQSIAVYRRLLGLDGDAPADRYRLADLLMAAERFGEAQRELETMLSADAGDIAAAERLVRLLSNQNGLDAALAFADRLTLVDATAAGRLAGLAYALDGNFTNAIQRFDAAFAQAPSSQLAQDLFRARFQDGQQDAAFDGLQDWLSRFPEDDGAREILASGLIDQGQYAAAARHYELLLPRNTANPVLLNNLAWIKQELNSPDAVDYARQAYRLAPRAPEIMDTLGWLLIQNGALDEGLPLLRRAAEAAPDNPDIAYHLAFALNATGDREGARTLLQGLVNATTVFDSRPDAERLLSEIGG